MAHPLEKSDISTNNLTGEAYLNSRREYWHEELKKSQIAHRSNNWNEHKKKEVKSDNDLSTGQIISIIIGGLLLGALLAWAGNMVLFFLLFIGAMLLKCMR